VNALTITPTNRCKPEWRNLSPRAHCNIRSARLGTGQEYPGRMPQMADKDEARARIVDRRALLLAMIGDGTNTAAKMRQALSRPTWLNNTLDALLRDGMVTYSMVKGIYALPKVQK
jgi:hypothetical protein